MLSERTIAQLLEEPNDESNFGWTLCFIGDDQQTKLAELVRELKNGFSETGDGKKIVSGFLYWGIGPTISWFKTSTDAFYPVMRESLKSFKTRWNNIYANLKSKREFHYVSLGVGTGEKDQYILEALLGEQPNSIYFPVDMSSTMLKMAIQEVSKIKELTGSRILPIQIDFSEPKKINRLRELLDKVVPRQPILFSLLGNTLANFEDDAELLKNVCQLMHVGDLLLIEVASTKSLDVQHVQNAAEEYGKIESFRKFVTSALLQNTDLHIDSKNILFKSTMEKDRAILIKMIYQNNTEEDIKMLLPDWSEVELRSKDTIRLNLTRKYTQKGIETIILENNLSIVDRKTTNFNSHHSTRFGMDLILVTPNNGESQKVLPSSIAKGVWGSQ
jgi:L-histidine Nalpha-methyltransferase